MKIQFLDRLCLVSDCCRIKVLVDWNLSFGGMAGMYTSTGFLVYFRPKEREHVGHQEIKRVGLRDGHQFQPHEFSIIFDIVTNWIE